MELLQKQLQSIKKSYIIDFWQIPKSASANYRQKHPTEMFYNKSVHSKKFTVKNLCQRLLFNKVAGLRLRPKARNFVKKESLAQVFSCELCKISKNIFVNKTDLPEYFF